MTHGYQHQHGSATAGACLSVPTIKAFTFARLEDEETGLLAYMTVSHAGIEFACVLRRQATGEYVLALPDRRSKCGARYPVVNVVSPPLRRMILQMAIARYLHPDVHARRLPRP